jgi:hypothetical protein
MRPPLAGKRSAARRLAEDVRRRLEPVERVLPVKLPGFEGRDGRADVRPAPEAAEATERAELSADELAARIDAARERLRATIEPPADGD